jgi:hypothetical protein
MARKACRPPSASIEHLKPLQQECPACGRRLWADYRNRRTVATLHGLVGLVLDIRRCHNPHRARHRLPYRPTLSPVAILTVDSFGWRLSGPAQPWILHNSKKRKI